MIDTRAFLKGFHEKLSSVVNTDGYLDDSPNRDNPINIIPSQHITMDGVSRPLQLIPDVGDSVIAGPQSGYYHFPGASHVLEIPVKEAQYRPRAETFAVKGDQVYGGFYPDGSFGVFGGGIRKSENPAQAAKREYREEAGLKLRNVKRAPVKPVQEAWKDPHPEYKGSETHFFIGELAGKAKKVDGSALKNIGYHDIEKALKKTRAARSSSPSPKQVAGRIKVLEHLLNKVEQ